MARRKIITIDEKKCNGCGVCIPNCPEGAIQIIGGKARLISDLFCDGLGACLGACPQGAIHIEERQAQDYDEQKVMENIVKQGPDVIRAHLRHLQEHNDERHLAEALAYLKERGIAEPSVTSAAPFPGGCPGSQIMDLRRKIAEPPRRGAQEAVSMLENWPVQLKLVPVEAPYFNGADLLIAADCVPFAYAPFHEELLRGKVLMIACPKLDDVGYYQDKLTQIFSRNNVRSVTYAHMEVPCCFSLAGVIHSALKGSGKELLFEEVTIGIKGERKG